MSSGLTQSNMFIPGKLYRLKSWMDYTNVFKATIVNKDEIILLLECRPYQHNNYTLYKNNLYVKLLYKNQLIERPIGSRKDNATPQMIFDEWFDSVP